VFLHLSSEAKEPRVDIFTPNAEVPFAGHPTIGTAFYILQIQKAASVTALTEKAGRIPISITEDGCSVKANVPQDFHTHNITFTSELTPEPAPCVSIVNGMTFILVALPDLPTLAKASKNLQSTYDPSPLDEGWQNGLVGTLYFVAEGVDESGTKKYRTRMMVDGTEDAGTGSASCALGCWLASREPRGNEKGSFKYAFTQGVEMGRRNDIAVEVARNDEGTKIETVALIGTAVTVMEGSLEV